MAVPIIIGVATAAAWGYRAYRVYRLAQAAARAAQVARVAQAARGAAQIAMAAERAEELSKAEERDEACKDCPNKIPCFDPPPNGNEAELARQLKDQQDAINQMSPDQILEQIAKYKELGREGAAPGEAALRAAERAQAVRQRADQITKDLQRQGVPLSKAKTQALEQAKVELKGQSVLHTPDLRAGGTGQTGGLGDGAVNRHIGNQWKNGRADALETEARKAKEQGQEKMNVELERC